MTRALHALVAMAAQAVPGLEGRVSPCPATPWHAEARLAEVHRHWATAHPEAGPHYAALRGWGLLVWQPAYLAVLSAHLADVQPRLDRVSLQIHDGAVAGYAIAAHEPTAGDEERRLHGGADQLAAGFARLLPAWQACAPLNEKAARRTCAECVLAALLRVHRVRQWPASHTRAVAQRWLARLGLCGEAGLLAWRDASGAEALATDRKVCCLHFRRRDGERCSTCPKLAPHERVRRLQAEEAAA
jgi:siderophore ferric iron reductase